MMSRGVPEISAVWPGGPMKIAFACTTLALAACQPAADDGSPTPPAATEQVGAADQAAASRAKTRQLDCSGGGFRHFEAKLDSSGWDPGSRLFSVVDATVVDNY